MCQGCSMDLVIHFGTYNVSVLWVIFPLYKALSSYRVGLSTIEIKMKDVRTPERLRETWASLLS